MSKIGISRFERLLAQQEAFPPDFQVLIASLSAHQESSRTARAQTAIARQAGTNMGESHNMVGLFADGAGGADFSAPGSFSVKAAALIAFDEGR